MKIITHIGLLLCVSLTTAATAVTFQSSQQQTQMIELFTSEGCSSCPPADAFLSEFKTSKKLWQEYIPMAFHVDYWDYLGWQDAYARSAYSERQRNYHRQGLSSGVYTPGFVVNGDEWTGFFKAWRSLPDSTKRPGVLSLNVNDQTANTKWAADHQLTHHLVVLGIGLTSEVRAGENQGKRFEHDFVVLDHQQQTGKQAANFKLPLKLKHQAERYAVVAWVTETNSPKPIQATGGYLPASTFPVRAADDRP